jgi:hypothetical protein
MPELGNRAIHTQQKACQVGMQSEQRVDSLRLTHKVRIDCTDHDTGVIGPQVKAWSPMKCFLFRVNTARFSALANSRTSVSGAARLALPLSHRHHIMTQTPQFRYDRKREILVGVEVRH